MQRTVVIFKPDAIQRGLIGEVVARLEKKGLKLVGAKMIQASDKLLEQHYAHHKGKPFWRTFWMGDAMDGGSKDKAKGFAGTTGSEDAAGLA